MSAERVRVLTLNLWGRRGDWEARRSVLIGGLRELRPDLVAFQEAVVTDAYDQVVELLGDGFHVAHQQAREPGEEGVERGQGISIASRWPIRSVREIDLHVTPRTAGFACGALLAEIDVPVARAIEEAVQARRMHVVLVGDLDAEPDAASIRFWRGRQSLGGMSVCYRDAWEARHGDQPGETFTTVNPLMSARDWPFRRIDYVFVRFDEAAGPTLDVTDCRRAFDEPVRGVWASDHFGVVADLAVSP